MRLRAKTAHGLTKECLSGRLRSLLDCTNSVTGVVCYAGVPQGRAHFYRLAACCDLLSGSRDLVCEDLGICNANKRFEGCVSLSLKYLTSGNPVLRGNIIWA